MKPLNEAKFYFEDGPQEDDPLYSVMWHYFNNLDLELQWYIAVGVRVSLHLYDRWLDIDRNIPNSHKVYSRLNTMLDDLSRAIWSSEDKLTSGDKPDEELYRCHFPYYQHNSYNTSIVQQMDAYTGAVLKPAMLAKHEYRALHTYKLWSRHEHEHEIDDRVYIDTEMADGNIRPLYSIRWNYVHLENYVRHFMIDYIKVISRQ